MKKVDFEHGSTVKNILQTALPMLVAQVLHLLYNIVDRIYIGRIPEIGTAALGAVGLCLPFIILINGFTYMFGLGGSPIFSMEYGRGNPKKAAAILNTVFRLEVLTGILIILIGEVFASPILHLFGATDAECVYALPYIRIYLLGTVFSMISSGLNPFINAQGFPLIGMMTVAVGAVANLILDPLLIFVLGLDISGAAIATVISQLLSAGLVMRFLLGEKNQFPLIRQKRIRTEDLPQGALFPYAGTIIGLGTAPFIMQVTNALVSIACNNVLMDFGGPLYVSSMTVINSVRQILDTPILAIADGASPTLSYNYGARRAQKVRHAIRIMTILGMSYTVLMWAFIELCPLFLVSLFAPDETLASLTLRPLHLYFYAFVFQAFQYSGQTVFKALGKKKKAIFFSLFRKAVIVVPLTFLLPHLFSLGTDGVFMAEPISNLVGGLACFITMLLTVLPELKAMQQEPSH